MTLIFLVYPLFIPFQIFRIHISNYMLYYITAIYCSAITFFKTYVHDNISYNCSPYYFYVIETLRSNFLLHKKQAGTSFFPLVPACSHFSILFTFLFFLLRQYLFCHLNFRLFILRQNDIQNDCKQCCRHDT